MANAEVTFLHSLQHLFNKGVRYSTVIDVGCADGHFFLGLLTAGFVPDAVPLNIDANPLYENSLRAIQEVVGGISGFALSPTTAVTSN
jgi:hypothetical protein